MSAPIPHDAWVDRARTVRIEEELARRGHHLMRQGHELVGPCPVCGGTDRFGAHLIKQVWNCRGCGVGGDVLDLVRHLDRCTFTTACKLLIGQHRRLLALRRPTPKAQKPNNNKASWLWSQRKPIIIDTPVARYLRKRGYAGVIPTTLGFLPAPDAFPPAMIAAFGFATEIEPGLIVPPKVVTGVHLTKLTLAGDKAETEPVKIMVGSSLGQPIVLAPVNDLMGLAITEGIEDGLTVRAATGLGVWVAGCAGRMPALAPVVPSWVETVTIYAHADDAGQRHAIALAERLSTRGIEVLMEGGGS
jgi:hypothetical protein